MYGGAGDDIYYVNLNGCNNRIYDLEDSNTIIFGDGIKSDKIKAVRHNWNDLSVRYGDNKTFIISGYFVLEENRNYTIQFNDGKKYIIKLSDDGNIPSLELAE